jgi:hypothetical protein
LSLTHHDRHHDNIIITTLIDTIITITVITTSTTILIITTPFIRLWIELTASASETR